MISFKATKEEVALIRKIVERALPLYKSLGLRDSFLTMEMDLTACHANGCPLDLQKLLDAPQEDFEHDVLGIRHTIDRNTGKLDGFFDPRCSMPVSA